MVRREREKKAATSSGRKYRLRGKSSICLAEVVIDGAFQDADCPAGQLDAFKMAFPEPAIDAGSGDGQEGGDIPGAKEAILGHILSLSQLGREIKHI